MTLTNFGKLNSFSMLETIDDIATAIAVIKTHLIMCLYSIKIYYTFTNYWDEIGYDWKIRNSQDNSFTIDANKSYILKTTEELFYKIRFTDFYNSSGVKGYPTFEIQKL